MNLQTRQFLVAIGGIFGAGFVHRLLPPGDIWLRALITAASAMAISVLLMVILPGRRKL